MSGLVNIEEPDIIILVSNAISVGSLQLACSHDGSQFVITDTAEVLLYQSCNCLLCLVEAHYTLTVGNFIEFVS